MLTPSHSTEIKMSTQQTKPWSKVRKGKSKRNKSFAQKSRRKSKQKSNITIPVLTPSSNINISTTALKQKCQTQMYLLSILKIKIIIIIHNKNKIINRNYMKESNLFKGVINEFKKIVLSNYLSKQTQNNGIHQSKQILINVICYGLGNFRKSLSSMDQLALLCSITNHFKQNTNDIDDNKQNDEYSFVLNKFELFEPLLTPNEKKVLSQTFNIDVLRNNTMGKYLINDDNDNIITLCFMPHCLRILHNNLLYTNWFNKYLLSKLYIIGNSFDQYDNICIGLNKSNQIVKDLNFVLMTNKLKIIKQISLEQWLLNNKNNNNKYLDSISMKAFAFQYLQYFPIHSLNKYNTKQWIQIYDKLLKEYRINNDSDIKQLL